MKALKHNAMTRTPQDYIPQMAFTRRSIIQVNLPESDPLDSRNDSMRVEQKETKLTKNWPGGYPSCMSVGKHCLVTLSLTSGSRFLGFFSSFSSFASVGFSESFRPSENPRVVVWPTAHISEAA